MLLPAVAEDDVVQRAQQFVRRNKADGSQVVNYWIMSGPYVIKIENRGDTVGATLYRREVGAYSRIGWAICG